MPAESRANDMMRPIPWVFLASAALVGCAPASADDVGTASASATATARDTSACAPGDPSKERHGTDCMCCHGDKFGIAGSIAHDAGVAWVLVTDSRNRHLQIAPNPHDNFFRHQELVPPISATVVFEDGEVRTMRTPAPSGSCNSCHGLGVAAIGKR